MQAEWHISRQTDHQTAQILDRHIVEQTQIQIEGCQMSWCQRQASLLNTSKIKMNIRTQYHRPASETRLIIWNIKNTTRQVPVTLFFLKKINKKTPF